MNELAKAEQKDLVFSQTGKTAFEIMAADKAAEIAERLKDPAALKSALIRKLHAQRDFAAIYHDKFPLGRNQHSGSDSAVRPSGDEWCLSFGFHVRTVRRWIELLDPDTMGKKEEAIIRKCWELAELYQAANFSSESNEWYTPKDYLDAVHEVLGGVDLDPASCPEANATVRATRFFTEKENGLRWEWFGRVFLNPPYGKEDKESRAGLFCHKAIEEYDAQRVKAAIILVNSLHSQSWQEPLYQYPICFVDHRIQFVSGDGEKNKNPTFQNIFVYLGPDEEKFCEIFSRFGYVMQPMARAA